MTVVPLTDEERDLIDVADEALSEITKRAMEAAAIAAGVHRPSQEMIGSFTVALAVTYAALLKQRL